jgi:hypothetical protein
MNAKLCTDKETELFKSNEEFQGIRQLRINNSIKEGINLPLIDEYLKYENKLTEEEFIIIEKIHLLKELKKIKEDEYLKKKEEVIKKYEASTPIIKKRSITNIIKRLSRDDRRVSFDSENTNNIILNRINSNSNNSNSNSNSNNNTKRKSIINYLKDIFKEDNIEQETINLDNYTISFESLFKVKEMGDEFYKFLIKEDNTIPWEFLNDLNNLKNETENFETKLLELVKLYIDKKCKKPLNLPGNHIFLIIIKKKIKKKK